MPSDKIDRVISLLERIDKKLDILVKDKEKKEVMNKIGKDFGEMLEDLDKKKKKNDLIANTKEVPLW
jgi:hypothetical protein